MGSKSKQKGAQFERNICRKLSLWVTCGEREDVFWRSAMSGGRATLRGRKAETQTGDISAIHSDGEFLVRSFLIECKYYQDLDIPALVFTRRGRLALIWKKESVKAKQFKKIPLLIVKQNRQPIMVGTNNAGLDRLEMLPAFNLFGVNIFRFPEGDLYYFPFENLLKLDPTRLRIAI